MPLSALSSSHLHSADRESYCFVFDSFRHFEPVESFENWSDMVVFRGFSGSTGESILNSSEEYNIIISAIAGSNGAEQLSGSIAVKKKAVYWFSQMSRVRRAGMKDRGVVFT